MGKNLDAVRGTPAASFPTAKFDDIEFPYSDLAVEGAIRAAEHEFPHTAGAEIEKMGRKAYRFRFTVEAHDVPGSHYEQDYPDFYPVGLRNLIDKFEREITGELVVPTRGTVVACALHWTQTFDAKTPSGEKLVFEFVEDQDTITLTDLPLEASASVAAVSSANSDLQAAAAIADFKKGDTLSIFQKINDAVTAFEGVLGQADAYNQLIAGKIESIKQLVDFADQTNTDMQDPKHYAVLNALLDLKLSLLVLADNTSEKKAALRRYVTPKIMSVAEVANTLYGSTDHVQDVLEMNPFPDDIDKYRLPAGTTVKYVDFRGTGSTGRA